MKITADRERILFGRIDSQESEAIYYYPVDDS